MDETIELKISVVDEIIKHNPYVSENYDKLVQLAQACSNPLKVHDVYKQKLQYFRLKPQELINWYDSLLKIQDDDLKRASLQVEYFELILSDYPNSFIWKQYLNQCTSLIQIEMIDDEDYKLLLQRALNDCVYDFVNSHEIWQIILSYFYNRYLTTKNQEDWDYLIKLHLKRLSNVHETLDDSFSEFSSLISQHDSENYDQQLIIANKIYSKTKSNQHYYEKYEIEIKTNPENVETYIEYIENVAKYDRNSMMAIFNRIIQYDYSWSIQWQKVWMIVIHQLYNLEQESLLQPVLLKFVRTFPQSCIPYAELIRNCIQCEAADTLFSEIKQRIDTIDLMHNSEYSQWKVVAQAILQYQFIHDKDNFHNNAFEYVKFAIEYNNDKYHSIEKLVCSIFQKLEDTEQASNIVDLMVNKFNDQVDVWLYRINYLLANSGSVELIRQTFQNAISYIETLDDPEKIIEEWLVYEQVHGDLNSYRKASLQCASSRKQIKTTSANEQHKKQEREKPEKRKLEEEEPVRSREEFTVKVSNITCTKQDLTTLFQDCGEIREINLLENTALIEFTNDQSVLSALTKNHKRINNQEISITRIGNTTLYVNNFPSNYTQAQLQEKFASIGPIISIRFPHQNNPNKTKRFCYVQYVNPEDAKRAIVLYNGEKLHDDQFNTDFTLQVLISKPQEKKPRTSAISDRKIRVSNLSFELNEDEIKQIFIKYGKIDSIVIPRKNKNHANEGIAVIVFEALESVNRALELNNHEIRGRKIHVERPKHHQSQPITIRDFNKLKTVRLTNIDTTLKSNDIKTYFETFGSVERVLIIPETASALVEFTSATIAGKVSLTSEKIKLGQSEVTVTDMSTTTTTTSTTTTVKPTQSRMMIPTSVKRRKKN